MLSAINYSTAKRAIPLTRLDSCGHMEKLLIKQDLQLIEIPLHVLLSLLRVNPSLQLQV